MRTTLHVLDPVPFDTMPLAPVIQSGGGLRAGLVYFPCRVCNGVVDLVRVNDPERPPLCDRHRSSDLLESA